MLCVSCRLVQVENVMFTAASYMAHVTFDDLDKIRIATSTQPRFLIRSIRFCPCIGAAFSALTSRYTMPSPHTFFNKNQDRRVAEGPGDLRPLVDIA